MRIRAKIISGFLMIILPILIIGYFSTIQLNKIAEPINKDIPESINLLSESSYLDNLAQFIRYYDEVLTQSARNYAFTGDIKWKNIYYDTVPKLDEKIILAIGSGRSEEENFFISVDEANIALIEMEEEAISLVDEGQLKEAIKVLESDEYWKQKEIYKTELVEYVENRGHDYNEAFSASTNVLDLSIQNSRNLIEESKRAILILLIVLIFVGFLLGTIISAYIINPIKNLQEGIKIIEEGDLNYRVGIDSKDEIGELSRSFDKMTMAIRKSRAEIDKKVGEQTKDIIVKQKTLENQQKAILNILEDVEKEKELTKKERDKIDIILHSIGDGVFVVDKGLRITMINKIALDLCQCFADKAIGSKYGNILKFINEKTGEISDKFIKNALRTGQIQEMKNHTFLVRRNGAKISVADSAAPFKDKEGNIIGCVVVFRDVSKEREVDRMKTEFVSIASHQLRTPLTSISWFTEMLLSKDVGKINKKQEEYLHQVYNSNKRMIKLVNDLLNVSRIETGKVVIIPKLTQIEDLIKIVLDEIKVLAKSNNVSIIFKKPKTKLSKVKLDPNLISQIVQNLLSNAIRYNNKNGKVVITVDRVDKELLITVADTGIGIPKKDHDKMFTKFFRADNAIKKQADGNGLGLYVNKAILEASGGRIWFESEENKGTTFYVSIPVSGMQKKKGTRELVS